jgi:hypothetical protein
MPISCREPAAFWSILEKTALRLVALASARNPSQAAVRLRMPGLAEALAAPPPWLLAVLRELKAYCFHAAIASVLATQVVGLAATSR